MSLDPILSASLAVAFALAGAPAAVAQTPSPAATTTEMSLAAIEAKLSADGFQVYEIERYATSVEVKGRDKTGACVELHLDRRTGEVLRRERDDDCGRRGGDDRGRRGHQ